MSVKISELPILDSLADNDVIAGVDTSANVTSKIEMATLKNYIDTNTQYTAGTNIDITNNVISAPFVYDRTQTNALLDDFKDETNALIEDLETNINEQLEEKDEQIEELQSEVDSLSTIYNAFPTESGEGESMTLDDTAEVKFKKFDLKGNASQGNTDKKNKITFMNMPTTTGAGISITPNNSELMLSGTASGSFPVFNATDLKVSIPAGTYTFSLRIKSGTKSGFGAGKDLAIYLRNGATTTVATITIVNLQTNNNVYSQTFTINESANLYLYAYVNSNEVSLSNLVLQAQLESGSTMTDYVEYSIPTPSSPIPVNVVSGDNGINVVGKNLAYMKNGTYTYNHNTGVISNNNIMTLNTSSSTGSDSYFSFANGYTTQWAPTSNIQGINDMNLTSNGGDYVATVITNKTMPSTVNIYFWTSKGRNWQRRIDAYTKVVATMSLDEDEHIKDIGIWVAGSSNVFENYTIQVQLEKGNTATDYEPYQGNTYNIDLPVENLFDKGNANVLNAYLSSTKVESSDITRLIYIECKPNTTYTISKIKTARFRVATTANVPASNEPVIDYAIDDTGTSLTITTSSTSKYLCSFIYHGTYDTTITLQQVLDSIQIEYGSKVNSYTPFGTTPIELCKIGNYQDYFGKSDGRNLFDNTYNDLGMWITNIGETTTFAQGSQYLGAYCKVEPGTYTISRNKKTNRFRIGVSPNQPTGGSSSCYVVASNDNANSITIDVPQGNNYICIYLSNTSETSTNVDLMIEKGSSASDYQPYGVGKWYLHKEIGKVVLDGSESGWHTSSLSVEGYKSYYVDSSVRINQDALGSKCNYFEYKTYNEWQNLLKATFIENTYQAIGIRVVETLAPTLGDFKIWLSTHNTIAYFVLANPTNTEVEYQPLIDQLNLLEKAMSKDSQTNISQVSNDKPFIICAEAIMSLQNVLDRLDLLES